MSLTKARELRQDRMNLIESNRALIDRAEEEGRGLNDAETQEYDKRHDEIDSLLKRAERLERQHTLETEAADVLDRSDHGNDGNVDSGAGGPVEYRTVSEARAGVPQVERLYELNDPLAELRAAAFRSHIATGRNDTAEIRALEAADDTEGGYMVPPEQFVADLIKAVDDATFIRGLATVNQLTSGDSMGRPSLDTDPADSDWTSELAVGSEESSMAFGKRTLTPHALAKYIKVSKTLIRRAAMGVEPLVRERLAYKQGITQEKAFLTGSGAGQPLGVFTADASGISTGRDVSTDNTTTAFTADGLINAKYSLKGGYLANARWIFHRDAVKMLSKLKDGDGQYLWSGSMLTGDPDRLLGMPVLTSEYAPNTFTTGLYVGILGDFRYYWIAEALNVQIERLNELFALTNQVGFVMRSELDGMPVLEEAFARVTLA